MEDIEWEQRHHVLTHIISSPEPTPPPLYSQFFISTQVPCYLNWHYPPLLCPTPLLRKWALSRFLNRLTAPETSWRSQCPYSQPPPVVLAKGLEAANWGDEEKREYAMKRVKRRPLARRLHPFFAVMVPNILALSLFLWNPFPD
ncbi:unnamed protein product [Cuscuta epithymum]|uniref:Uncharacterized protein n=1 Tax=Cuscuta epithymum TaxID=186058 RepID=A0AAV0EHK4_9ASTE|nr:unnamed protein product [Cuscuta epithymum]